MAGRTARGRRPTGAADRRACPCARRGSLHRRHRPSRHAPRGNPAEPARARAADAYRCRRRVGSPRSARRPSARRRRDPHRRAAVPRRPGRGRRRRDLRAGARRPRAPRCGVGRARAAARSRRGGCAGVIRRRRATRLEGRRRTWFRRGGRRRRSRVPDAERPAQRARDTPVDLRLGRRWDHRLHLDAVDLGSA